MSVEAAIHERWAAFRPLTEKVPIAKVFTGNAPVKVIRGPDGQPVVDENGQPVYELTVDLPFVTVERVGNAERTRTSHGVVEAVQYRLDIWAADLDEAKEIAGPYDARFDRADFPYSEGRVLDCKITGTSETEDNAGVWHVAKDSIMRLYYEKAA